ncbi:MAG: hypothetical protein ACR2GA_03770 [Chloroflexota bacterium]
MWQEFLTGYCQAADPESCTHAFYLAHAREYHASSYDCFSYHYEAETCAIRFHFGNRDDSGLGLLSRAREPVRRRELAAMFADIRRELPEAEVVRWRSWMSNLPAYCRLFPPEYVRSLIPVQPELQFMSLWGQFLARAGNLRPESARMVWQTCRHPKSC